MLTILSKVKKLMTLIKFTMLIMLTMMITENFVLCFNILKLVSLITVLFKSKFCFHLLNKV